MKRKSLGVAVVGSGRMGTLRASVAAAHPAVEFLAVSDTDPNRARLLAEQTGADFYSGNNLEVISRPEINAVVVSTGEAVHALPVMQALERGKSVLVEKPMAIDLKDADDMLSVVAKNNGDLRIGYSRRFKRSYLVAKEQILAGRLGQVVGATLRVYNSRAQALQVLQRSPGATPVTFGMTYYVDIITWFLQGNRVVEVIARGQKGVLRAAGYKAHDVTWAILTFSDGAVVNLGADYALPAYYPTFGANSRVEILGTEGVILIDDDNHDQILYTDRGIPHNYVPDHTLNFAFMGSHASGDWAQGNYWGPLADETRNWLDHLSTGRPCSLTTAGDARKTLEITLAIEESASTSRIIRLDS